MRVVRRTRAISTFEVEHNGRTGFVKVGIVFGSTLDAWWKGGKAMNVWHAFLAGRAANAYEKAATRAERES